MAIANFCVDSGGHEQMDPRSACGLHDSLVHIKAILTVEFPSCQYARGM